MTMVGRWASAVAHLPVKFFNWLVSPEFDRDVEKIRLATERCCGFVPTVACVASILTAANPTVVGAGAIASAICAAMTSRSRHSPVMQLITPPPQVNGIIIEGDWK